MDSSGLPIPLQVSLLHTILLHYFHLFPSVESLHHIPLDEFTPFYTQLLHSLYSNIPYSQAYTAAVDAFNKYLQFSTESPPTMDFEGFSHFLLDFSQDYLSTPTDPKDPNEPNEPPLRLLSLFLFSLYKRFHRHGQSMALDPDMAQWLEIEESKEMEQITKEMAELRNQGSQKGMGKMGQSKMKENGQRQQKQQQQSQQRPSSSAGVMRGVAFSLSGGEDDRSSRPNTSKGRTRSRSPTKRVQLQLDTDDSTANSPESRSQTHSRSSSRPVSALSPSSGLRVSSTLSTIGVPAQPTLFHSASTILFNPKTKKYEKHYHPIHRDHENDTDDKHQSVRPMTSPTSAASRSNHSQSQSHRPSSPSSKLNSFASMLSPSSSTHTNPISHPSMSVQPPYSSSIRRDSTAGMMSFSLYSPFTEDSERLEELYRTLQVKTKEMERERMKLIRLKGRKMEKPGRLGVGVGVSFIGGNNHNSIHGVQQDNGNKGNPNAGKKKRNDGESTALVPYQTPLDSLLSPNSDAEPDNPTSPSSPRSSRSSSSRSRSRSRTPSTSHSADPDPETKTLVHYSSQNSLTSPYKYRQSIGEFQWQKEKERRKQDRNQQNHMNDGDGNGNGNETVLKNGDDKDNESDSLSQPSTTGYPIRIPPANSLQFLLKASNDSTSNALIPAVTTADSSAFPPGFQRQLSQGRRNSISNRPIVPSSLQRRKSMDYHGKIQSFSLESFRKRQNPGSGSNHGHSSHFPTFLTEDQMDSGGYTGAASASATASHSSESSGLQDFPAFPRRRSSVSMMAGQLNAMLQQQKDRDINSATNHHHHTALILSSNHSAQAKKRIVRPQSAVQKVLHSWRSAIPKPKRKSTSKGQGASKEVKEETEESNHDQQGHDQDAKAAPDTQVLDGPSVLEYLDQRHRNGRANIHQDSLFNRLMEKPSSKSKSKQRHQQHSSMNNESKESEPESAESNTNVEAIAISASTALIQFTPMVSASQSQSGLETSKSTGDIDTVNPSTFLFSQSEDETNGFGGSQRRPAWISDDEGDADREEIQVSGVSGIPVGFTLEEAWNQNSSQVQRQSSHISARPSTVSLSSTRPKSRSNSRPVSQGTSFQSQAGSSPPTQLFARVSSPSNRAQTATEGVTRRAVVEQSNPHHTSESTNRGVRKLEIAFLRPTKRW